MQHLINQSTFRSSESLVNVTQLLANWIITFPLTTEACERDIWMTDGYEKVTLWMTDGYEKVTFFVVSLIVKVCQLLPLSQVLFCI